MMPNEDCEVIAADLKPKTVDCSSTPPWRKSWALDMLGAAADIPTGENGGAAEERLASSSPPNRAAWGLRPALPGESAGAWLAVARAGFWGLDAADAEADESPEEAPGGCSSSSSGPAVEAAGVIHMSSLKKRMHSFFSGDAKIQRSFGCARGAKQ